MECPPRTVRLVVVVLALGAATSAMAQTVLPVASRSVTVSPPPSPKTKFVGWSKTK